MNFDEKSMDFFRMRIAINFLKKEISDDDVGSASMNFTSAESASMKSTFAESATPNSTSAESPSVDSIANPSIYHTSTTSISGLNNDNYTELQLIPQLDLIINSGKKMDPVNLT